MVQIGWKFVGSLRGGSEWGEKLYDLGKIPIVFST